VLEAIVDPNVPPIPPHIEWDQAKKLMQSIMAGDPDAREVIRHGLKEKIEEYLHR
jgi:pyruvate dehydrogenase (quinone)